MWISNTLICILLFALVYETWTTDIDVYDNGLNYDSEQSLLDLDDVDGDLQENALRRYKRSSSMSC